VCFRVAYPEELNIKLVLRAGFEPATYGLTFRLSLFVFLWFSKDFLRVVTDHVCTPLDLEFSTTALCQKKIHVPLPLARGREVLFVLP
jgi:hypothetical protein